MGNRIRELRKAKNMTLKDLGKINVKLFIILYRLSRFVKIFLSILGSRIYFSYREVYNLLTSYLISFIVQGVRIMGNRIRELRKAKNMTLKDLGKILGVAESTVSQYETGKRQPDNETLLMLGEFFGVPVGYLLGSEIEKAPSSDGSRLISDDDIKFALWGTQEIDDEVLDQVKAFAKFARENTKNRKSD